MIDQLQPGDAVVVVDIQKDFCPGGALAVPAGDEVVPVLNRWIEQAERVGATVVLTRDWHPPDHCSFKSQGGPWPAHCVQGTAGAEYHPDLRIPQIAIYVDKATESDHECYSDFAGTTLGKQLHDKSIKRLWVGGLALDSTGDVALVFDTSAGGTLSATALKDGRTLATWDLLDGASGAIPVVTADDSHGLLVGWPAGSVTAIVLIVSTSASLSPRASELVAVLLMEYRNCSVQSFGTTRLLVTESPGAIPVNVTRAVVGAVLRSMVPVSNALAPMVS